MAWVFSLSAECGSMHKDAEIFSAYFRDVVLILSDGIEVRCSSYSNMQDREKNWWVMVNPEGVIAGGNTNFELCKTDRATEIGFLLYEQLKSAPPFRYAIVGWEVDGFLEENELASTDWQDLNGLVLSEEFCERLGCQSKLEPFAPKYYWRPYRGENWEPYPNKKLDK